MKKFLKILWLQIILFVFLINLCGCSNNNDSSNSMSTNDKVKSELSYLDSKVTTMINLVDNVKFKNYEVSTEPDDDKSGNSSNSEDSQENIKKYQLTSTNVLIQDNKTDWESLKNNVESLEEVWPTIVLDLYDMGVNSKDILNVSNDLDSLVKVVKDENKEETLNVLSSIYKSIPKFMEGNISDDMTKNIYSTKANIFLAYSLLEKEDWDNISKYLGEAEKSYDVVLNKVIEGEKKEKEYNINKAYIELKELQNCVKNKDKDIFLIKYKNLLEELNTI